MREIKFRVWDTLTNRWFKDFFVIGEDGRVYYLNHAKRLCSTKSLIPIQYTGLKDMNGKEIYEDDIDKDKELIRFVDGAFVIGDFPLCSCKVIEGKVVDIEIIGNIHKNPELLEKK